MTQFACPVAKNKLADVTANAFQLGEIQDSFTTEDLVTFMGEIYHYGMVSSYLGLLFKRKELQRTKIGRVLHYSL